MDLLLDGFTIVCLVAGCFLIVTGAVGVLRMPDFYTRIHPAGKNDTLGLVMIVLGLLAETLKYSYGYMVAAKLLLILLFVVITAPAAAHAISKAAYLGGLKPWNHDEGEADD